jgi:hypothetical protein
LILNQNLSKKLLTHKSINRIKISRKLARKCFCLKGRKALRANYKVVSPATRLKGTH